MFIVLFRIKCEKTVEDVNKAFLGVTGDSDWGINTMEDIERLERDGFMEFKYGFMTVYADITIEKRGQKHD